jgi:hypothetical protein
MPKLLGKKLDLTPKASKREEDTDKTNEIEILKKAGPGSL